jgi:hypothetical protein
MPPFHIRFDSYALEQWPAVGRCSFVYKICYLGFPCRWLVSLKGENRHRRTSMQSVARFQIVKSYRTSKAASIPPVHSLRINHTYDKFAGYCNPKVRQI